MARRDHSSNAIPEGEGAAAKRSNGRWAWAVLVLLPVAAWVVVLVLVLTYQPQPIITGDALYDRFLAAVAAMDYSDWRARQYKSFGEPNLASDNAMFVEWEKEFGTDPRFWMLCYKTGSYTDSCDEINYLEEARRRGIADGAILLELLREYDSRWRYEVSDLFVRETKLQQDTMRLALDSKQHNLSESRRLVDERHFDEHRKLQDELFDAVPDAAQPYYYAMQIATERGDYDEAWKYLSQGNCVQLKNVFGCFPYHRYMQDIKNGYVLPDMLVSGNLAFKAGQAARTNEISQKDIVKLLTRDAVNREDFAALDELHTYACRYRDMGNHALGRAYISFALAGIVSSGVTKDMQVIFSLEESKALKELDVKLNRLRQELIAVDQARTSYGQGDIATVYEIMGFVDFISGTSNNADIVSAEHQHDEMLIGQTALPGKIDQLFREIECFDYATLSWEQ
jgi:hypothetical protein